jgi:hypothetical protein
MGYVVRGGHIVSSGCVEPPCTYRFGLHTYMEGEPGKGSQHVVCGVIWKTEFKIRCISVFFRFFVQTWASRRIIKRKGIGGCAPVAIHETPRAGYIKLAKATQQEAGTHELTQLTHSLRGRQKACIQMGTSR